LLEKALKLKVFVKSFVNISRPEALGSRKTLAQSLISPRFRQVGIPEKQIFLSFVV